MAGVVTDVAVALLSARPGRRTDGGVFRLSIQGGEEKAVTLFCDLFSVSLESLPDSTVRNAAFALLTSNQVESFAHKTPTRSQSPLRSDARSFRVRPNSTILRGKLDRPPFQCICDDELSADRHNRPGRPAAPPQPP
jgi:hypothetical protein